MSPTVNNFVHDLVAMAKAMEDLPMVQAQLEASQNEAKDYADRIQRLELRLIDAHNETDAVRTDLRRAEEDRDEATRAFLEADDRTDKALAFVRSLMGNAQSLIEAVEPPRAVEPQVQGQSESLPIDADALQNHSPSVLTVENGSSGNAAQTDIVQPQLDPGPSGFILYGDASNIDSVSTDPVEVATVDPTASSVVGDGHSQETVEATPIDDVGYHNEPTISGDLSWRDWDTWAVRMNRRYGAGSWPARQLHPNTAQ